MSVSYREPLTLLSPPGHGHISISGLSVKDSSFYSSSRHRTERCLELPFLLGTWGLALGSGVALRSQVIFLEDACLLQDGIFTCEAAVVDSGSGLLLTAASWIEGTYCCVFPRSLSIVSHLPLLAPTLARLVHTCVPDSRHMVESAKHLPIYDS